MSRDHVFATVVGCLALSGLGATAARGHEVTHYDPVSMGMFAAGKPTETGRLSAKWCGRETYTDDVVHETGRREVPKFKVIEAYPADVPVQPDRRDFIQAAVMASFDHVAIESGMARSLRLDLGTECGARYLDIQTLRFKETKADLAGDGCFDGLTEQVREATQDIPGLRNYVVFAPEVRCNTGGYGEFPNDDSKSNRNRANEGLRAAMIFSTSWLTTLHEILHTVGAVQKSAPHNDPQTYHCWDDEDVMCYIGLYPAGAVNGLPVCDASPPPLDCNKDDYFNPSPADGSYLDTHWNVWDSVFLCELAECVPPPPPAPPVAAPPAVKPASRAPAANKRQAAKKRCAKAKGKRAKKRCKRRRSPRGR